MDIVIYGAPNCPACNRAKQLCEDNDLTYTYCDATQPNNYRFLEDYFKESGESMPRYVPMIFIDNEFIGDANALDEILRNG